MDDLAESVIKHLSVADGKGPCAAVCSTAQAYERAHPSAYAVVVPVIKDGTQSFNIDYVEEEPNINTQWAPHASFNVATVKEVAQSLQHWQSTVIPGKVPLLIEVANWNGYPLPGVGGRTRGAFPGFGVGNRKEHNTKDDIEETIRFLGMMRAPVSA
jgi:hypothetical protein